jgi:conjugal transfer pilus assembly protein TraB
MSWQDKTSALIQQIEGIFKKDVKEGDSTSRVNTSRGDESRMNAFRGDKSIREMSYGDASPLSLRKKQLLRLSLGGSAIVLVVFGVYYSVAGGEDTNTNPATDKGKKIVEQQVKDFSTPLSLVDNRELWASRLEKTAETARKEADSIREENQFLQKRVDVLEDLFSKNLSRTSQADPANPVSTTPETQEPSSSIPPQHFPPINGVLESPVVSNSGSSLSPESNTFGPNAFGSNQPDTNGVGLTPFGAMSKGAPQKKKGPKILHLTRSVGGGNISGLKSPDIYLPAGTYVKAIVDMGIAVSTAVNSQGNPEPIRLRLVDNGNLPGGLKGKVKDAVLIGACYGDISSERARCRLETLSWRDKQGVQIEKKIEGWVVDGADGIAGLRGKVIDRSGDIAREAFGAGLLSAAANFLKFEATSSVYPVTPFGQTNALSKGAALQGAVGSGASNALDKLAEFSIKRAEQMSPIIYVPSGRLVDILLKTGVDLTPDTQEDMKLVGGSSASTISENQEN